MADEVRLKDEVNKDEIPVFMEATGCKLCLKKLSKYTCPRCNVKYCSLDCYRSRKHVECSEKFYKNCVMETLQGDTVDNQEKRKMVEILKRFEKEESEASLEDERFEADENLEERLEGLNLEDTEKVWAKLTQEERREFQTAVNDGYIGSLVDVWEPWWITRDTSPDELVKTEASSNRELPKRLKKVPQLSSLIKSKPASNQTKYNIVNILYSYVYICRYYNGCHQEFLQEAIDRLCKLSTVLYHAINFTDLDSAIKSAVEASQQHKELFSSEEFSVSVIDDIILLLQSNGQNKEAHFVELALSDIHRLLAKALKSSKVNESGECKDHSKSIWMVKKKIIFMLSWFRENHEECLTLLPFLPVVKEAVALEFKQLQREKSKIQKSRMQKLGKKLIEEIN